MVAGDTDMPGMIQHFDAAMRIGTVSYDITQALDFLDVPLLPDVIQYRRESLQVGMYIG